MPEWFPFKPHVRLRRWKGSALAYCVYAGLWDHAFDLGGLPDNPKKVAQLLDLDPELVKEAWSAFKADCVVLDNGRLMPREIVDADSKIAAHRQKRMDAGKAGGHKSGERRRKPQCQPDAASHNLADNRTHVDHLDAVTQAAKEVEQQMAQVCSEPEGALADALEALFPAETAPHRFLELGQFVLKVRGCPADVRAWREWFRTRYPSRAATVWTFKESFAEMVTEAKSLSVGARFIIATSFNKDSRKIDQLSQTEINLAVTQGRLLDQMVGLQTSDEWKAQGFSPTAFQKYWQREFNTKAFPSPQSIVKYWDAFKESLQ